MPVWPGVGDHAAAVPRVSAFGRAGVHSRAMSLDLARRAFLAGDVDRCLALAQALLAADPADVEARSLRANVHLKRGDLDAAIDELEYLHRQHPDDPRFLRALASALNARGSQRLRAGDSEQARHDFTDALMLLPDLAPALFNLALVLTRQGETARAEQLLARLLEVQPDDVEARLQLAELVMKRDPEAAARLLTPLPLDLPDGLRLRAAATCARADMPRMAMRLLQTLPSESGALRAAVEVARELGFGNHAKLARELGEAIFSASQEGRRSPGLCGLLAGHLALPPVPEDARWLQHARQTFERGLAALHERLTPQRLTAMAPSLEQLAWSNFLLAYQGEDDRQLQESYGRLLARCLAVFKPALQAPAARRGSGRVVGFVGSSFRDCTAGHYFGSWPRALSRTGFEVRVFQLGPRFDDFTARIGDDCAALVRWEQGLDALADALHQARLDLIVYPELGMDMRLLPLAALRLAPRQACAWGHPVTSGLATIDAFISCAAMEPDDAAGHYSEQLHLLPGIGTHYLHPGAPQPLARADLGLPEGRVLGLFPQAPFKIHPDNDALLARIAAAVPGLAWVLFEGESVGMTLALRRRLGRALREAGADPDTQLLFLPLMPRNRYLAVNAACDFMLDSLHWSGGNTSLDAFACGLPVLTCPGRFMRGRQSAAMLRLMDLDALIQPDSDSLAQAAIALASDPGMCRHLRTQVASSSAALFGRDDALEALPGVVHAILAG